MYYKEDDIFDILEKINNNQYSDYSSIVDAKMLVENRLKNLKNEDEIDFRYRLLLIKLIEDINIKKDNLTRKILEENYDDELTEFLNLADKINKQNFVFIFSGTNRKESFNTSRPIKLSLQLKNNNIPVIYSTWIWDKKEDFEKSFTDELMFETPINKTIEYMLYIIKFSMNVKHKIFIVTFPYPNITKYIEIFKFYGWTVIYDIMDDWEEFNKVKQARWYKKEHEIYLIKRADIVTAVAKPLIKKFKYECNKEIYLIPNALDCKFVDKYNKEYMNEEKNNYLFFNKIKNVLRIENNNEDNFKVHNRSKIGYVGHLTSSWFDWESLIEIAKTLSEYEFEIIGHSMQMKIDELPKNIKYLGPKSIDEVFEISKEWKIGIIPFKINKLSEGVDPIKVYEYLAMGLKVISFTIPQIINYPEVKLVSSIDEFVDSIKSSMKEDFNYIQVDSFLKVNTWQNRINEILKLSQNISEMR